MGAEPSEKPLADCSFPFSAHFPPGIPSVTSSSPHTHAAKSWCTAHNQRWAVGVGQGEFPVQVFAFPRALEERFPPHVTAQDCDSSCQGPQQGPRW